MKLNKTRQKLYLDGKVGLINDNNDVEQLREVTNDRDYMGKFTYYHKNRIFPSDAPLDNIQYHPISWFYENEKELQKRVRVDKANDGWYDTEIGNVFNVISGDDGKYFVEHPLNTEYLKYFIHKSDCTLINQHTPTSYKLNIDIPEWLLKAGDDIEVGRLPLTLIKLKKCNYERKRT